MIRPSPRETGKFLLGTRIHELELGEEPVAMISDLHLRPEGHEEEKTAALDRVLATLPAESLLVVLGDLFDYWVGYKQGYLASWQPILERFKNLQTRGIRSFYLWGNRDYQLDSHFESQVSGVVVPGGLRLRRANGATLLCLHGDELCLNDKSYQTAKKRLRSWPLRWLGHHLPISLGLRLATKARSKSQEIISTTAQQDLQPSKRALHGILDAGHQTLLFGHIHIAGSGVLSASGDSGSQVPEESGRYFVLPAFEAQAPDIAHFDLDGSLHLFREGLSRPWPGPIPCGP